jgi:hypothetical protein
MIEENKNNLADKSPNSFDGMDGAKLAINEKN